MVVEDDFDFYPCLVDGAPASIYLNLRFEREPPPGADTRYTVTIQMRDAGPFGVGTAAEADDLSACEEALIARAAELGLVYVGRIRNRGTWEMTFHGPAGHAEILRATAAQRVGDRHVDAGSEPDPDWRYYRELLLPDAERRQWMDDRRLVQILSEQGDALTTPRRVDHWAYFPSAQARDAFVAAAAAAGFTLERASEDPGRDHPFGAQVSRIDPIELDHIHDAVMILVDAADAHGGDYDRWVTSIERG